MDESGTNLWLAELQTTLAQTLIDSVLSLLFFFFFKSLSNVYCRWWMYLFLGPASTSLKNFLSVRDWVGGRPPFFFIVFLFWRLSSWILNELQSIAINHNLWRLSLWENWCIFFLSNLKKIVYGIYTWQSVEFLFQLFNYGWCFLPTLSWVLSDRTQRGSEPWLPCVFVRGPGQDHVAACVGWRLLYFSKTCSTWVLPRCWRWEKNKLQSSSMHIIHIFHLKHCQIS